MCGINKIVERKSYNMKSILQINVQLLNNNVEEQEFRNDNAFSKKCLIVANVQL